MAETIVGSIVFGSFISQMNMPFMVNLRQIKKMYRYVPVEGGQIKSGLGGKERSRNVGGAITFPPPPPMTMGAPPQVMVPTPDFSVAQPSYRREEVKAVYRVEDK